MTLTPFRSLALLVVLCWSGAAAAAPLVIPVMIEQNLVLMTVQVGASPPLAFIVDTGAENSVIAEDRLAATGLSAGETLSATAQGGEIDAAPIRGATMRFGGVTLRPETMIAVDLSGLSAGLGRRIDGIIGYELFERFVVRFDYDRRRLILIEPGEYRPEGHIVPLEIRGNTPFVAATVNQGGRQFPARFLIDTGAVSALTVYGEFVAAHPELVPSSAIALTGGALLPGQFRARVGHLDALAFGPESFRKIVANFSSSSGADDAAEGDSGQIGGEVLSRFDITFDYAHRRMLLIPGRRHRAPFLFDASGLSLVATGERLEQKRVRLVLPDTPGALAGLAAGDVVQRIDGKPTASMSLGALRELLRRPGRVYRLEIVRNGVIHRVRLRTRVLI